MFWTVSSVNGSIWRSWMDGSNHSIIIQGLRFPLGITIDFDDSRLYWVTEADERVVPGGRVYSSGMQGGDLKIIVELPIGSFPIGIGVWGDRVYWTSYQRRLQSSTKSGQDIQYLTAKGEIMFHMVIVPRPRPPISRKNDCANKKCSENCAITPESYRCLPFELYIRP